MRNALTTRTSFLLLVFAVLGVYYPAIFSPLNSVDDPGMYQYLLNCESFRLRDVFFPGGGGEYYRPLLVVSYLMDKYVWGLHESFMHLENIVFHLCNTLLLFAVARRACLLQGIEGALPPLIMSLAFALHPVNTEAVNWIAGRTDLLACFFVLLSMWLLLRFSSVWLASCSAAFSFFLACLAKETAIFFLPAAIIAPFFVPTPNAREISLRFTVRKNVPHFLLFVIACVGYLYFRTLAFSKGDSGVGRVLTHVAGDQTSGFLSAFLATLKASGFYVKKLFIPFPLNFAIIQVSDLYIFSGAALFLLVFCLLVRRTLSGFFLVAAFFIGSSALMIPLLRLTWTPLAERYLYIPSAFFIVGMGIILYENCASVFSRKLLAIAVCLLLVVAVYGTTSRTLLWQDNLAFFQDTLKKSPDFMPAKNEVANALLARGRECEAIAVINSIEFPKDLTNFQLGMMSKASAFARKGDTAGARDILLSALKNPGKYEARIIERLIKVNESEVLTGRSKKGAFSRENIDLLNRLYQLTGDPFVLYRLGQTCLNAGDTAGARNAFLRVVAKAPEKMYYRQAAEKLLMKF